MIILDFYGGSHGHFLEYVINTYIFNGNRVDNLISSLGTCHGAVNNSDYEKTRTVYCGHYTQFNKSDIILPTKVVTISVDSAFANICYQINVETRAGDIPHETKVELHPAHIKKYPHLLRNAYYSKYSEPELGYCLPNKLEESWKLKNIPTYNVSMESLYNIQDFYATLKKLSNFLKHTFNPDPELAHLWQKFVNSNQGLQSWKKTTDIIKHALLNEPIDFELSILDQALVNYHLTQSLGIHDGALFDQDIYPTNSQQIWQEIQYQIETFDSRF